VTGRDRYLTETVKGTDKAAHRRAEKVMTRLLADVDKQRAPETSIPLSRALGEWLRTVEIEETTRRTYVGYIERHIRPALGAIPIDTFSQFRAFFNAQDRSDELVHFARTCFTC
jgi:integrase